METTLDAILISLAKKQLTIEYLEERVRAVEAELAEAKKVVAFPEASATTR